MVEQSAFNVILTPVVTLDGISERGESTTLWSGIGGPSESWTEYECVNSAQGDDWTPRPISRYLVGRLMFALTAGPRIPRTSMTAVISRRVLPAWFLRIQEKLLH